MLENKVHIQGKGSNFRLKLNGKVVNKLKYLEFRCGIDEPATVTAEFYADEVEIEEGATK